jgi:hypothetical protein
MSLLIVVTQFESMLLSIIPAPTREAASQNQTNGNSPVIILTILSDRIEGRK